MVPPWPCGGLPTPSLHDLRLHAPRYGATRQYRDDGDSGDDDDDDIVYVVGSVAAS